MKGREYQEQANRTNDGKSTLRLLEKVENDFIYPEMGELINACLGLPGEVGEVCDMIKKWIFHGSEIDVLHVKKEIGDIMWYVALMCTAFHFDLDDVMETNIEKLKARYPDGFDTMRSNNRSEDDV